MSLDELRKILASALDELQSHERRPISYFIQLAEQNGWDVEMRHGNHYFTHPRSNQYNFTIGGQNQWLYHPFSRLQIQRIFQPQIAELLDELQQINTRPHNQIDFYALNSVVSDFFKQFESQLEDIESVLANDLGVNEINAFVSQAKCRINHLTDTLIQEMYKEEQELRSGIVPNHIQALQDERDEAIANVETLTKEKQNLEEQLQAALESKERFTEYRRRLEHQVSAKEAEITALGTKVAELQQALEQSQLNLETQRTQARTLEHEPRTQIQIVPQTGEQRASDLRRELEIAQTRYTQLQAERDRLARQLRDREQALSHTISTLQIRLSQGAQEITTLQQQTQKAQADKHTAELALHTLQQQLRQLESHSNTSLTGQLSRLRGENSSLQATLGRLQDQLSSTEQALQRLQGTHSDQNTLIESLQYNLIALTAEKQRLETATQQLQAQLNRAEAERVQLQGRLSEFERLADDRQIARAKASREIERLEAELAEAKQQVATAVNQRSIQQWLRDMSTQVQARGVRRWLVRAAVAVAVFCVSWISQVM